MYLGAYNNFINAEKVNALCTILEAFGNTKTCLNSNATRMTQLLSLDFDQTGQIASASLQVSFSLIHTIKWFKCLVSRLGSPPRKTTSWPTTWS